MHGRRKSYVMGNKQQGVIQTIYTLLCTILVMALWKCIPENNVCTFVHRVAFGCFNKKMIWVLHSFRES